MLWKLAGQRRKASAQQLREALGPDFSLWDDFPEQPGQACLSLADAQLLSTRQAHPRWGIACSTMACQALGVKVLRMYA